VSLDGAGNTLQARGFSYTWNQAGQLRTVSQGATLLATHHYDHYDHRGLRSRKQTTAAAPQGAGTVVYHYDAQGRLVAETAPNGTALVTYVWRDDVPQALIVHGGTSKRVLYLEVDHLGSPIAARNQGGRLVWKWESESDAFGSTLPSEGPDGVQGGSNVYAIANANPQRYTDPQGLRPVCLIAWGVFEVGVRYLPSCKHGDGSVPQRWGEGGGGGRGAAGGHGSRW